jgi:uncharacterized protein
MRLKISDIPDEGLELETDLPIVIQEGGSSESAHVVIRIVKKGLKVLAEGSLRMKVSQRCSRCLKGMSVPVNTTFRDEYTSDQEIGKEDEQELTGREMDLGYYSNDELDVSEMIKEQVLLALPMKPLCGPDCKGLCPRCGKDLNEGACGCADKEIDPRLAPLGKLKIR